VVYYSAELGGSVITGTRDFFRCNTWVFMKTSNRKQILILSFTLVWVAQTKILNQEKSGLVQ